jgi:3',5'-cyclic AMP phosphodiesterase CpdA
MTAAARGVITRAPYLQAVTSTSAQIGWVTTGRTAEHVALSTMDGSAVAAITAAAEAEPRAGALQQWSTLDQLEPATIYCYGVANDAELASRTGFRTAPAADSAEPVRFLAFGDSGTGGRDQLALRDRMFDFPFDLVVHTGDIAYESGTLEQFEKHVFAVYGDLFKNIPFFPSPGNHDYGTAGGAPYRQVFALPNGERYYSFDWGRVHFVALDTQSDFAEQARWLDQDLAATTLPWKIVYMHKPAFSSGPHGDNEDVRHFFVPLFEKHRVQLVLAGHDHNYERIEPQNGVAYVVTGGGGAGTRIVGTSSFTAFAEEVIHFVYVEVGADELVLHAIDGTGVEFDSMVVPRSRPSL